MGVRTQGPFPALPLAGIDDGPRPLSDAWRDGEALLLIGHRNCKTTRQTLPFLDRIHRRRGAGRSVVAILQDDAATARELRDSLALAIDVRLEPDPYPLAAALDLGAVPTLFLVGRGGEIERVCEAFVRAELESFAARLGVPAPLFAPEDDAPALRPG